MADNSSQHMTKAVLAMSWALGDGKVDTSPWFKEVDLLEEQIQPRNLVLYVCSNDLVLILMAH